MLKKQGILVNVIPNPNSLIGFISRYTPFIIHRLYRKIFFDLDAHKTYYSYNNIDNLKYLLEKQGFSSISVVYFSKEHLYFKSFILKKIFKIYSKILEKRFKNFMSSAVVIAKK